MKKLPYATGYFHFASESAIRLAGRLIEYAPAGMTRVMFGQGGSDAVDTAIRAVRYYFNATGRPMKKHFVGLECGYHGSSATGSGLTALPLFHRYFDVPSQQQHHIPSPYPYRHPEGPDEAAVLKCTVRALENKVIGLGADNVAAFICEPVQGSGGVIIPPAGFLRAMRDACDRLDILLIVDEFITGFGRTGPMLACAFEDVTPDVLTLAKGLTAGYAPMSATLITEKLYQVIAEGGADGTAFGHGQTYAGHPVSAAVGNAVLDLYTKGGLLENRVRVGQHFASKLRELQSLPNVGEVRIRGMLAAVELVAKRPARPSRPRHCAWVSASLTTRSRTASSSVRSAMTFSDSPPRSTTPRQTSTCSLTRFAVQLPMFSADFIEKDSSIAALMSVEAAAGLTSRGNLSARKCG